MNHSIRSHEGRLEAGSLSACVIGPDSCIGVATLCEQKCVELGLCYYGLLWGIYIYVCICGYSDLGNVGAMSGVMWLLL